MLCKGSEKFVLGSGIAMPTSQRTPKIIVLLFYFMSLCNHVIGMCPMRCECDDESLRVRCHLANLDVVPITLNPELRELHLSNNHIKAIRTYFSVYRNLEFLDMSHNQLVSLDKGNFVVLKHLKVLMINHNIISTLQNDTFKGLESLTTLHLNENLLVEIISKSFIHLDSLELLDMCQNRIANIDEDAFFGLKNLKTLLLRDNKLTNIPSSSFQHIPKLFNLDLGLNSFIDIPENAFSTLNDLQELSLDGCAIAVFQDSAFKWLNSLLILRIHDNELRAVPTKSLYDVIRLEELHIGQNKFKELPLNSFQRLSYLQTIEINSCSDLERIEKGVFADNTNLKKIVINHNKVLRHIEDGAFDNLPNLKHVSFRGNSFKTFQSNLLPWDELESLDVRDNPLVCNCSLLWLWKLFMNKNFSSSEGQSDLTQVICAEPLDQKGKIFQNLSADDLDCYHLNAKHQIIIGIVVAAAIAVAAIVLLGFRYFDKVAGVLKTKWGRGRKEPQYQKTSVEEESTILQAAAQQSLKMTPVTEL